MTIERFSVSARINPKETQPPKVILRIDAFCGHAIAAAREYCAKYLLDYELIQGSMRRESSTMVRFEAVNSDQTYGAVVWVNLES